MKWTLLDSAGLNDVLETIARGRDVYAPERLNNGRYGLTRAFSWQAGRHTLGAFRQTEPLKSLFFPAREFIGQWQNRPGNPVLNNPVREPMPQRVVFGVKNCDLSSLAIYDHVFLQGLDPDPYYAEAREKTLLVSSDCSDQLAVCFCPVVGEQPWANQGFDINIARTPEGHVLESGTARGAKVLQSVEQFLQPAGADLLEALERQRAQRYRELVQHSQAHGLKPGIDLRTAIEGSFESELWEDFAADCVECGACNFICCTCHCFLLADGLDAQGVPARSKLWDACLYSGFARTAGGGNPRALRSERLRNRFDKKFSYFPQVMGRYACDGCGRCSEACIANIDIRDVLRRAIDDSGALHAHSGDH